MLNSTSRAGAPRPACVHHARRVGPPPFGHDSDVVVERGWSKKVDGRQYCWNIGSLTSAVLPKLLKTNERTTRRLRIIYERVLKIGPRSATTRSSTFLRIPRRPLVMRKTVYDGDFPQVALLRTVTVARDMWLFSSLLMHARVAAQPLIALNAPLHLRYW